MAASLGHRGPDDHGAWLDGGTGLAHSRLSIIDLSTGGHQPMAEDSGRYVLVYNGEIYNFADLRAELAAYGEAFHSGSDTEVLLLAYRRWGRAVLPRLNGMFAFAVFDRAEQSLFLARDRFGEKPLYYTDGPDVFVFGSEIKAILDYPGVARRPDLRAIHHYLSMQYVPGPWTAFDGVRKLPPGTGLTVTRAGAGEPQPYWRAPEPDAAMARRSAEDLRAELRSRLDSAVRRRLAADVPVGAFLSGGVDSSAVVGLMSRAAGRRIRTYSIGFEEADHDERVHARRVAELFDTDHTEAVVRPDVAALLERIVWHYGEPFADPSALPTFCLAQLARRGVKVALSGDGGDELFLGYTRYDAMARLGWTDHVPTAARSLAAASAAAIPGPLRSRRPFAGVGRRLKLLAERRAERYEPAIMAFFESDKTEGYGPALRPHLAASTLDLLQRRFERRPGLVAGAALADLETYLPDDILTKVDVATMAVGLESRAPFLDPDLADFALRLPQSTAMPGGQLKGLLKAALEDLLPQDILYRPKMGFGVPLERWLKGELHGLARDLLLDGRFHARGLLQPAYVESLLAQHAGGQRLHHTRIWSLIMLELWFRIWIDGASSVMQASAPAVQEVAD